VEFSLGGVGLFYSIWMVILVELVAVFGGLWQNFVGT
jgi:hypothetical protein